jgi:hypothetical protein
MITWLKAIGSAGSPVTEWEKPYVGVITANRVSIRPGDHLFLYAPGGSRRIFALAVAVSDPEHDSDYNPNKKGSCRWKLSVRYDINLPVTFGIPIDDVSSHRDLAKSVRQKSHIKLHLEESELAHSKLKAVADSVLAEEIVQPGGLVEGAVHTITVNAYERNPEARRQCIEAHGTTCCICGFTFGAVYGRVAEGYIHVHHLRPLAEVNGEYVVDPSKDLRPVCPNCHAVLHRGSQCRSIDEVRLLVEDNRA